MRDLVASASVFLLQTVLICTGCGSTCSTPASITGAPAGQTVDTGDSAIFTVAASGSAPIAYQWLKNGSAIPDATQASFTTSPTQSSDSGAGYAVKVSNAFGSAQSNPVTLTVNTSQPHNLFVAPNGNDSNAGTIEHPFQTIQQCATTAPAGWTCQIRAGIYRETVTPNSNITITAYNFELVTIDGSDPISGWTRFRHSIYRATAALRLDDTNQIFVGNQMMTEARWPNGSDFFRVNWSKAQNGTDSSHIVDSRLPGGDWTGAKIHLWSGTDPFGNETGVVVASGSHRITIDIGQTGTCSAICPTAGGLYYLYGSLNALDAEGEWFYDVPSATLYFYAPNGVNPNTLDVRAKRRQFAFDLRGKSGVKLRNLSIFASSILTDKSSSNNDIDRITATYVSHFTDLPVSIDDPGGNNFSILRVHNSDTGIIIDGTGNTFENSTIAYSAGTGIALEGNGNTIRNNLIHDIDYVGDYSSGIVLDGDGNTITYNTIYNVGRQAILVNAVTNEDISYNNLHHAMLLSRDGAEIYACCFQSATGTRIHHNWIHDTKEIIGGQGEDYSMAGIDIDNSSGGFEADQNVIWANQRFSVVINGAGGSGPVENNVHHNTIPDSSDSNRITLMSILDCTATRVSNNRTVLKVDSFQDSTVCAVSDNVASAPGAVDMSDTTEVGCNFTGCSTDRPRAVQSDGTVTPCPAVQGSGSLYANIKKDRVPLHRNSSSWEVSQINCYPLASPSSRN